MKRKIFTTAFLLVVFSALLFSCSDKNEDQPTSIVPEEVIADFQARFPSVTNPTWSFLPNLIKAEFKQNGDDYNVFFFKNESWQWIKTEQEVKDLNQLPQPIKDYINANYPDWRIDDADIITIGTEEYYEIELEKAGEFDVTIFITSDGTFLSSFVDRDENTGQINESNVPSEVLISFYERYPKAQRIKWEREEKFYEAEFILDMKKHEAIFQPDGTWSKTEIEIKNLSTLPEPIKNYVKANYEGYVIDDAELVQVPNDEFYKVEIEKSGNPDVTILIYADGTLVSV